MNIEQTFAQVDVAGYAIGEEVRTNIENSTGWGLIGYIGSVRKGKEGRRKIRLIEGNTKWLKKLT
jgi:hypothetical protein